LAEVRPNLLAFAVAHLEWRSRPDLAWSRREIEVWCRCVVLVRAVAREQPDLLSGRSPLGVHFP
jgi:hypothetical protein